jgi:predicted patatin/cPLA2 family phospholipase
VSEIQELLRARAARGSSAPHNDGASIALCVEGGAMRGVVSAGMVTALEELGLTTAFDAVYGSSAGALNGAYFLAGQAALGSKIYWEDINNTSFISVARAFGGHPIVHLDFFTNEVMTRRKPLDAKRVLRSATKLIVVATDIETGERTLLKDFTDADDLRLALRASATMPIVAGGPTTYRGRKFFDASLTEPIPVPAAECDGHTHIVALLTRPPEGPRSVSFVERWFVAPRLAKHSPALAAQYLTRMGPYSTLVQQLANGQCPQGKAKVLLIRPDAVRIRKLERSKVLLLGGAKAGRDAALAAFSV